MDTALFSWASNRSGRVLSFAGFVPSVASRTQKGESRLRPGTGSWRLRLRCLLERERRRRDSLGKSCQRKPFRGRAKEDGKIAGAPVLSVSPPWLPFPAATRSCQLKEAVRLHQESLSRGSC